MVIAHSLQVSYYPQDDGSKLFCVEILFDDDTWDILGSGHDFAEVWGSAEKMAAVTGVTLLPESMWPGRSHLLARETLQ